MASRPQTTVFVSGLGDSSDESTVLQYFSPFGEVMDVQLPRQRVPAETQQQSDGLAGEVAVTQKAPHRGFAFVVFATEQEAEDAIDNMNLNEIDGRIVSASLAKPHQRNAGGADPKRAIWDDEEWIKEHGSGAPDNEAPAAAPETEMASS